MMLERRVRSVVAAIAMFGIAGLAAAGCGGSSTTTVTAAAATTAATTSSTTATATTTGGSSGGGGSGGSGGSGGGGAASALAGINPPPGSKKLSSRSGDGVVYVRYSTPVSPKNVVSNYTRQLSGKGWTIVNRGGSGGGWGPYGGSSFGVTGKKNENDYIDVQAGGQSGHATFVEVCATTGKGTRSQCDQFSDQANHHTHSGGSQSGSNNHSTNSGGS
jgi:hypothetical protein